MSDKQLFEEMKQFFKVDSLEEVAQNLGYKRSTANTWRSRGITNTAMLKYNSVKSKDYIKENSPAYGDKYVQSSNETVTVNLYEDVYAAAGHGAENHSIAPIPIRMSESTLRNIFNVNNVHNIDIINVTGDSMEPFFQHGDKIVIERTNEAYDNSTVVASIDGQLYVKKLLKDPFGRWVKLTSMNTFYPDIILEGDEIALMHIIGVVRGKWRPI